MNCISKRGLLGDENYIKLCYWSYMYLCYKSVINYYLDISNILVIPPQIRYIEVFDITNPPFNEKIWLVPSDFVKSRFHCNNNFCFATELFLIRCCFRRKIQYLVPSNRGTLEVCTSWLGSYVESFLNKWRRDQFWYIKIKSKRITPSVPFVTQSLVRRSMVLGWILIYQNWSAFRVRWPTSALRIPYYTPNSKPYSEFLEIHCDYHSSLSFTPAAQIWLHIYFTSFHSAREIWTQ